MPDKLPQVSVHQSVHGTIEINWEHDYDGSLLCQECGSNRWLVCRCEGAKCKVMLRCRTCKQETYLTCRVPQHIFRYQPDVNCPNPLCNERGPDGKTKGWIFMASPERCQLKCHYCDTRFKSSGEFPKSWVKFSNTELVRPFCFEDDLWDLRNFFENPQLKTVSFDSIQPDWYRREVKCYLQYLLRTEIYSEKSIFGAIACALKSFGIVVEKFNTQQAKDISRKVVLALLDSYRELSSATVRQRLKFLQDFFDWLKLESQQLIRSRDYPKAEYTCPDWLDEKIRTAIRQHLHKVPAPIARQYQVQEYTAARPGDVCRMPFDCLVEEDGQWYIKFFQQKVQRPLKLPATREIRLVIEEQQQWVRETLQEDYLYLFCHFRGVASVSYPKFSGMKPLPEPPHIDVNHNRMVRIIRLLIEKEDIRDANGQRPHFTGKITRSSRLQEVRTKYGIEAAQLYADHKNSRTTFQHYTPPTREQLAEVDLPIQKLLLNPNNRFLPWQSLPESLLKDPQAHELDMEISPRLVVYGYCVLDPKVPCPYNLYPKCYGCGSFCPSTSKLPLYERQYAGEKQRMEKADAAGAELAFEEAKSTVEAMDKWLPDLRGIANG